MKNIHLIFVSLLTLGLVLTCVNNNPASVFAQINQTSKAISNTGGTNQTITAKPKTNNETFSASGSISSLVFTTQNPDNTIKNGNNALGLTKTPKFVLSGDWVLTVNGGKVTGFNAKFIKVLNDGERWHTHVITNFKANNNSKAQLTSDKSASISGTVDVKLNGTTIWNAAGVNILLNKGKTITINLDNKATGNHFQGQPIYGVVESIKDANGNEMLKALQHAVQQTER